MLLLLSTYWSWTWIMTGPVPSVLMIYKHLLPLTYNTSSHSDATSDLDYKMTNLVQTRRTGALKWPLPSPAKWKEKQVINNCQMSDSSLLYGTIWNISIYIEHFETTQPIYHNKYRFITINWSQFSRQATGNTLIIEYVKCTLSVKLSSTPQQT
jgi:hypothetical protein